MQHRYAEIAKLGAGVTTDTLVSGSKALGKGWFQVGYLRLYRVVCWALSGGNRARVESYED